MGSICVQHIQKDECSQTVESNRKNLLFQGTLAQNISIEIIYASYRQCKGESLLVIVQSKNLHQCEPLRQFAQESLKTIELIQNVRKTIYKPTVIKTCPYKKLLLCIMPIYQSEDVYEYKQLLGNVLRQALEGVEEITTEFMSTINGVHSLPNQIVLDLMFKQLVKAKPTIKLNLVANQKKLINMYRYELIKTEKFVISETKY